MTTFDLLLAYLQTHRNESDIVLNNYELNGSIIKLTYSYNPNFSWDKEFIDYGNIMEIDLLDYIAWVFNRCNITT